MLIKTAQVMTTRPDLLPPQYIKVFKKFLDDCPALDFNIITDIIHKELGQPLERVT